MNYLDKYLNNLSQCILFKSIEKLEINKILESIPFNIQNYKKDEVIAVEGDDCHSLGIILQGNLEIHKPFSSGKIVTINHFKAGNIFGEALVFSGEHIYPATIVSSVDSQIMYIKREDIVHMMTLDSRIIDNFMGVLSDRILMLNNRITNLSFDTLRKKITNIILLEYGRQKSPYLTLPYSRKKMAELLNIPRPSLSRELINMREDGLIDFYRNKIKILDLPGLQQTLME